MIVKQCYSDVNRNSKAIVLTSEDLKCHSSQHTALFFTSEVGTKSIHVVPSFIVAFYFPSGFILSDVESVIEILCEES